MCDTEGICAGVGDCGELAGSIKRSSRLCPNSARICRILSFSGLRG